MNIRKYQSVFRQLYGSESAVLERQYARYQGLIEKYRQLFGTDNIRMFSTPGRTEVGGNHTDHNHGRVLAASVNIDSIAVAAKTGNGKVTLWSEGYDILFEVELDHLEIVPSERGTTHALIRGIAARLRQLGYHTGGFNACLTSDVLPGSGLSSSASVEVLIGTLFNDLYHNGNIPLKILAMAGQYAENHFFDKPCGLMDQLACAIGGVVSIDFADPEQPLVEKVDFDFESREYRLLVVDTGGNHADLTEDYAAVPAEMKAVAEILNAHVCREIDIDQLYNNLPLLRERVGDRAILRAMHFLDENQRVSAQTAALKSGDFRHFLSLVNESGNSSFKWLQNIYSIHNIREQGVTLALALTGRFIEKIGEGACRVHGGGFAGTIQAFLPVDAVSEYTHIMESVFGAGATMALNIRPIGALSLDEMLRSAL